MLVRDIGEFRLIETLSRVLSDAAPDPAKRAATGAHVLRVGIGDDAAAWDGPASTTVLTTDTMVEGVHFDLAYVPWEDLGWKSIASNVSDIAAMGCAPLYSVVTLGLRGDLPVEGLRAMYRGMAEASRCFGGAVVGGDVVRSPTMFVTVAMTGVANSGPVDGAGRAPLLTRDAARPGQAVCLTGHVGCAAAGLEALRSGRALRDEVHAHLAAAHLRPTPRLDVALALPGLGIRAAIDVSDGLVADLARVCEASQAGAVVWLDRVPADAFLKEASPDRWRELALGGGEDYELLFVGPRDAVDRVRATAQVPVTVIGEMVPGPPQVVVSDEAGGPVQVPRRGWDHFA